MCNRGTRLVDASKVPHLQAAVQPNAATFVRCNGVSICMKGATLFCVPVCWGWILPVSAFGTCILDSTHVPLGWLAPACR